MSSSLRPRVLPQCSSCLRSYALGGQAEGSMRAGAVTQQVRGKKKVAHAPSTVPVRLLRDVKAFGKKGSIVPIAIGNMRNSWFPRRIAEYVTVPELRQLRLKNTSMERDFEFGTMDLAKSSSKDPTIPSDIKGMSTSEIRDATSKEMKKPLEIEKLSPERSAELVDIFVPPRLEFYRQPIIEEKAPEPEPEPELERPKRERQKFLSNAASDLLAARTVEDKPKKSKAVEAPSIYGSVSSHDVLVAVRAAMGNNDESRRVVIEEEDLRFVGLTSAEAGKIKHVGEYALEINVKGVENGIKRTVRVIAQEL
ncbi:hypothetical protein MBLNU230_g4151t1 [Neophaeotheca triangularis]